METNRRDGSEWTKVEVTFDPRAAPSPDPHVGRLLSALPAGEPASVSRWNGPHPVSVDLSGKGIPASASALLPYATDIARIAAGRCADLVVGKVKGETGPNVAEAMRRALSRRIVEAVPVGAFVPFRDREPDDGTDVEGARFLLWWVDSFGRDAPTVATLENAARKSSGACPELDDGEVMERLARAIEGAGEGGFGPLQDGIAAAVRAASSRPALP